MSAGLCLGGVTKKGTMISNLPLLFADGYPTCLDKITADQLEKFVPFMIRCSSGLNISEELVAPEWWPNDLEFAIPLVKPPVVEAKWLKILKNLVSRCYTYHGCDFMLRFCTTLSQCPIRNLSFTTCWDGTTSLYNKATGKLLVTFRNENMCYDERTENPGERNLLTSDASVSSETYHSSLLEIHICVKCETQFSSQRELQEHENLCLEQIQDQDEVAEHGCAVTAESSPEQAQFLNYFHLDSIHGKEHNVEENVNPPRQRRIFGSALRYSAIPFSSPLGLLVNKKSRAFHGISSIHLDRVERYCCSKPAESSARIREPRFSTWPVTWKPRKKNEEEVIHEDWTHLYKYPRRQWQRRTPCMQDEMSLKTMELIKHCQQVELRIRRLTDDEIKNYTSPQASQRSPYIRTVNKTSNINGRVITEDDQMHVVTETNSYKFHAELYKNETISKRDKLCNIRSVNILEPNAVSLERQLSPNTLYVYDKTALSVGRSQLGNISQDNSCIPVVDLMSSDDELDVFSRREHFPYMYERIPDSATFVSNEADEVMEECDISPDTMTGSNEVSNYCSDYGKDLPELIKFLSSASYQHDEIHDHSLYSMENTEISSMNLEKPLPRLTCDKSVQCSYSDFNCADYDYHDDDDDESDGCLEKPEKISSQTKLPKVYKNRREL